MAELDNLLGSPISLISQQDIRYDGVLFSINAKESSIVLRDVHCFGTETRVTDKTKQVPENPILLPFVSFPGVEIKDLYVCGTMAHEPAPDANALPPPIHEDVPLGNLSVTPPTPPTSTNRQTSESKPSNRTQQQSSPRPPRTQTGRGRRETGHGEDRPQNHSQSQNSPRPAAQSQQGNHLQSNHQQSNHQSNGTQQRPAQSTGRGRGGNVNAGRVVSVAGTGEHLLRMRVRKGNSTEGGPEQVKGDFDYISSLDNFKKEEVMAGVAETQDADVSESVYKKDDFFDNLSCDLLDREAGKHTRLSQSEERVLNQDTFGAVALQSNFKRYFRGGSGGRGGGGRGYSGRGRVDGAGRGEGGWGGRRGGSSGGRGRGRGQSSPRNEM